MTRARRSAQAAQTFIRNTLLNVVGRLCTMGVAFLLTPFILGALGNDLFGLWALAYALVSMPFLVDFGMNAAVQKYTAAYYVEGREGATWPLIHAAVALQVVFWEVLAAAAFVGRGWLAARLAPNNDLVPAVELLVWGVPALVGPAAAMWCLDGALAGLRRMDASNAAKVGSAVVAGGLSIAALQAGLGLPGLLLASGAGVAFGCAAESGALWLCLRRAESTEGLGTGMLAHVAGYGARAQATNLLLLATAQLDKLLLGVLVSVGAVTAYELGWRLLGLAQTVPMMLLSVIAPAASELDAHGADAALRAMYWTGSRLLAAAYVPLVGLLVMVAPIVVEAWVGPGYDSSVSVLRLLAVGAGFNLVTGMGTTIARGIGRPGWETAYVGGTVLVRLPLCLLLLVAGFGLGGVLWANLAATVVGATVFILALHHRLDLRLAPLWSVVLYRPVLATGLAMLAIAGLDGSAALLHLELHGRSALLTELGVLSSVFSGVYFAAVVGLGHFTAAERNFVVQQVPVLRDRRRAVRGPALP